MLFASGREKVSALANKFADKLGRLAALNAEITQELQSLAGKRVKSGDLSNLLGEVMVAELLGGRVDSSDTSSADVLVGQHRVIVRTRRGKGREWNEISGIPPNAHSAFDYLAFVHLNDSYQVAAVWIFPCKYLLDSGRVRSKPPKGKAQELIFRLLSQEDRDFQLYP
jgi:hypothetical protein